MKHLNFSMIRLFSYLLRNTFLISSLYLGPVVESTCLTNAKYIIPLYSFPFPPQSVQIAMIGRENLSSSVSQSLVPRKLSPGSSRKVSVTVWPMFGSNFFLQDLHSQDLECLAAFNVWVFNRLKHSRHGGGDKTEWKFKISVFDGLFSYGKEVMPSSVTQN